MKETDETLEDAERRLIAKFLRSVKQLNRIMEELRDIHPKASYYLAADSFHMMKGPSHGDDLRCSPLHENSIASATLVDSGGGDW